MIDISDSRMQSKEMCYINVLYITTQHKGIQKMKSNNVANECRGGYSLAWRGIVWASPDYTPEYSLA